MTGVRTHVAGISGRRVGDFLLFGVTSVEGVPLFLLTPTFTIVDWIYVLQHLLVLGIALTRRQPEMQDHSLPSIAAVVIAYVYPYAQVVYLRWVIGHADIPDYTIYTPPDKDLHSDWRTYPYLPTTETFGLSWLKVAKYAVLSVPSALEPTSRNYLINAQHPDTGKIHFSSIQDYLLDHRA